LLIAYDIVLLFPLKANVTFIFLHTACTNASVAPFLAVHFMLEFESPIFNTAPLKYAAINPVLCA